jgi:hypothetical protein
LPQCQGAKVSTVPIPGVFAMKMPPEQSGFYGSKMFIKQLRQAVFKIKNF